MNQDGHKFMAEKFYSAGFPKNLEEVFNFYGLNIRDVHGLKDFGLVDSGDACAMKVGSSVGDLMICCVESAESESNMHLKLLKNFKGVYSPKGKSQEKYYCFSPVLGNPATGSQNYSLEAYQRRRLLAETKKIAANFRHSPNQ